MTLHRTTSLIMLAAAAALLLAGCKEKDLYDPDRYKEIITDVFPIQPVDSSHTWTLTAQRTARIRVNTGHAGLGRLMIFTDDPVNGSLPEIMTEAKSVASGEMRVLTFCAPSAQQTFYAALQTDDSYYVVPFDYTDSQVNFDGAATGSASQLKTDRYQTFTYLFEEDYPRPGDYDFNDLVLRISLMPGEADNQLRLRVMLAALGGEKRIGAAVRLLNFKYTDILSITTEEGRTFDDGYPLQTMLFEKSDTLLRGNNNEAVVRLFEDAFWAFLRPSSDETGSIGYRTRINVLHENSTSHKQATDVVRTYVLTVSDERKALLSNMTLNDIDPFILEPTETGIWEVHTFAHKKSAVLRPYMSQDASLIMTWALCVPTATFQWSLEENIIGTLRGGALSGTYRQYGHSFGQWAANHNESTDWYLYPTETMVY